MVLHTWRNSLAYWLSSKQLYTNETGKSVALANAQKIGLLYSINDQNDIAAAKSFVQSMQQQNKQVVLLGLPIASDFEKQNPDLYEENNLLKAADISFWMVPTEEKINTFTTQTFDILINADATNQYCLHYIAAKAKADMKVGVLSNDDKLPYQLLLNEQGRNLQHTLTTALRYLEMINTK